jgi:hypothetical protein
MTRIAFLCLSGGRNQSRGWIKTRNPKSEIRNKFKFREFLNGKDGIMTGQNRGAGEVENQPRKSAKAYCGGVPTNGGNRQNMAGQNHAAAGKRERGILTADSADFRG